MDTMTACIGSRQLEMIVIVYGWKVWLLRAVENFEDYRLL